jgi:hypothetical protein
MSPTGHQLAARLTAVTGPYPLYPGPHLFTDWRYIEAGTPSYVDADGNVIALDGDDRLRPAWYRGVSVPYGIRIVAEKPVKSEPMTGPVGSTVLLDGGRYRSWNGANVSESDDAYHWTPVHVPGEPDGIDRNVLYFNRTGVHGPGVFVDPVAPPDERYKMVFWSELGAGRNAFREQMEAAYRNERPDDVDPNFITRGRVDAIFGATSPDGVGWTPLDKPLLLHMADNPNTMYYDTLLRKYVLYTRATWMYGRRSIGRSESDTFGNFPQPEMIVWPSLDRLPSDDLYTNAKCLYPGTVDAHFLFPTVYHRATDDCSIDMMSSPDGIHWFALPGNPVVVGDPDTLDDGCLFTHCGLVPLPDGSVGLPFKGSVYPHKYPRWRDRNDRGVARYAIWKRERLACVEATGEGCFTTPVFQTAGRELRLNFKTPVTGEIRVEVVAVTRWVHKKKTLVPVEGRSFADCDPLRGDALSQVVTWRGQSDLGYGTDDAVFFRFRLRAARLYAFTVS